MLYTNSGSHFHNTFYFKLTSADVRGQCDTSTYPADAHVPTNVIVLELKSQLKRVGNCDSRAKHFPGLQPATRNPSERHRKRGRQEGVGNYLDEREAGTGRQRDRSTAASRVTGIPYW